MQVVGLEETGRRQRQSLTKGTGSKTTCEISLVMAWPFLKLGLFDGMRHN
jgi:hypothetical protein